MADERWQPAHRDAVYRKRKKKGLPRLVSEGDSWFDYPPSANIIDYIDDSEKYAIKRFEKSGDTLENMEASSQAVQAAILKEKPLCLLLSAGGNDIVKREVIDSFFFKGDTNLSAREHITPAWGAKLIVFRSQIVRFIDKVGLSVPVVMHGYDYMPPSDAKVKYDGFRVAGPWMKPALDRKNIDESLHKPIARLLIKDFNEMLAGLQTQYPLNFIHVDLRGECSTNDWINEIHLREEAYERIAEIFMQMIKDRVLPLLQQRKTVGLGANP